APTACRSVVSDERDHVEGRLRHGHQRRGHALRSYRLGHDRQQERRDLRQCRAEAGRRRRQPSAGPAARPAHDGRGRKGGLASRDVVSEGFFEYHLYTLDGHTTIKDNQTKQLSLMAANEVPIKKELIYYGAQDYYRTPYGVPVSNQKVAVYFEVKNSKENRLG